MNNLKKFIPISSIILIILTLLIPVYNYFIGEQIINDYIQTKYILNMLVANTNVDFNEISKILTYMILSKDALIILSVAWFQILFIICFKILTKKDKGLITFIFTLLFHILGYIGLVIAYYFYTNLNVDFTFITVQTYLLFIVQIINSILFLLFSVLYIKDKIKSVFPLTPESFLNGIYITLKIVTVTLIVTFAIVTISFVSLYNVALLIISNISIESILNLPDTIQYDIINIFSDIPNNLRTILTSFQYNHWLFEVVNGEILINISTLSTKMQDELKNYVELFFNNYFPTIMILFGYYVITQVTNFLHKKLNYKNFIPLIIMFVAMITVIIKTDPINLIVNINGFIIVLISLYILFMIDNVFANYKYTNKICNLINNFKFSDSINEFVDVVKKSSTTVKDSSKELFDKVKNKLPKK